MPRPRPGRCCNTGRAKANTSSTDGERRPCSSARALLQGRLSPSVDDVLALARPVLQHRPGLGLGIRTGVTPPAEVVVAFARPVVLPHLECYFGGGAGGARPP